MTEAFETKAHTGFPGLDQALLHVRLGDNVVFQIDSIEDYRLLVRKYVDSAWQDGYPVVYFRFAAHAHLLDGMQPASQLSKIRRTPLTWGEQVPVSVLEVEMPTAEVVPAVETAQSAGAVPSADGFPAVESGELRRTEGAFIRQQHGMPGSDVFGWPADTLLPSLTVIKLNPVDGFERFVRTVYKTATDFGLRAFYVFDCLSDLLVGWASDLMIGNFFQIVCPYLFKLETVAYFSLIRGRHTDDTINRIRTTTQLLLNVYESDRQLYIHPLKVWNRQTSTLFLPHRLTETACTPMTSSSEVTSLYLRLGVDSIAREAQKDYWDRLFDEAKEIAIHELAQDRGSFEPAPVTDASRIGSDREADAENGSQKRNIRSIEMKHRLTELLFGRRTQLSHLLHSYLTLPDLVGIHRRQIGTGQIGGKAAGLLLARKILEQNSEPTLIGRLEPHDSFYLSSDLYYTYIVYNGWWQNYVGQKSETGYYTEAMRLQDLLLHGEFPEMFRRQFKQLLDYFGQAPIIVRSSSLLEDDYGHAFAGKYESVFCVNQGDPDARYQQFEQAIRQVYASTMNESALAYRQMMGLADLDEQMALLVQRVSGDEHGDAFYPALAGVGYSKNIYIWHSDLDPDAGLIRLVYGLGTRAVDRSDGDYTRLVSLDHPFLTTNHHADDARKYVQKQVDLLDLKCNQLDTVPLSALVNSPAPPDLRLFGDPDYTGNQMLKSLGIRNKDSWILNFQKILSQQQFIADFQNILKTLSKAYDYPVDMEFTVNFQSDGTYRINILQCRPLQVKGNQGDIDIPDNIDFSNVIISSNGEFMGGNIHTRIDYVIYIVAEKYDKLLLQDRYQVARVIGRLNRALAEKGEPKVFLIGPGRWGTTTPSLGIPVRFSEINRMTALAEYAFESAGMRPELSFGSHFFQDLVEMDIFYISLDFDKAGARLDDKRILEKRNLLSELLPDEAHLAGVIQVSAFDSEELILHSEIKSSRLICYIQDNPADTNAGSNAQL